MSGRPQREQGPRGPEIYGPRPTYPADSTSSFGKQPVSPGYDDPYSDNVSPVPLLLNDGARIQSTSSFDSAGSPLPPLPGGRVQFAPGSAPNAAVASETLAPGLGGAAFQRKRSLVRPDRERIDPSHRLFNYRAHTAQMEADGRGVAGMSTTGKIAQDGLEPLVHWSGAGAAGSPAALQGVRPGAQRYSAEVSGVSGGGGFGSTTLRRGKSILAREEGMANDSGIRVFNRSATLRRPNNQARLHKTNAPPPKGSPEAKKPLGPWMIYCLALTCCCPSPMLRCFGLRTKERQKAWREKMGLLGIIMLLMMAVGFLTFGFTQAICGKPGLRYQNGAIEGGSMIYHGHNYDMDKFQHPAAPGIEGGSNPLYTLFNAGGMDGSFLFQKVNQKCKGIITPAVGTGILNDGTNLAWYFPCNLYNQFGTSPANLTGYAEGAMCHTTDTARAQFAALKPLGQVYFSWQDLKNASRNLGVYDGNVLDFSLLRWLDTSQVAYPAVFDQMKNPNATYQGRDITAMIVQSNQRDIAECLIDTIRVGYVDSESIGCVASEIVLYVSLVFIIGVVGLRFGMAVMFGWFLSWRIGSYKNETHAQRRKRAAEIENWTDDIYKPAPARYRPNVKRQTKMFPKTSRFSQGNMLKAASGSAKDAKFNDYRKSRMSMGNLGTYKSSLTNSPPGSPTQSQSGFFKPSRSSASLPLSQIGDSRRGSPANDSAGMMGTCPFPLYNVVPQPPDDYEPFNFSLVHTICLVTAYSESVEGLRTTIDSLATTDFPNSHKLIMVIADGMVKGSGNDLTTPEIVLTMMTEFIVPPDEVEAYSYVAIADGHKRHNMAKVYAGFYQYDNNTVELSKQQRVPIVLVAKVGNAREAHEAKPGNRGKRDSQIILMAFLQKVMFDERMSRLEYEFFNAIWRCTGISPDRYEIILMVDADTKVFPDSVSRMVSCMVNDTEIMGICGETKIANKTDTWVTMIQVFEYYVSHNLTKAFESVFGGVTCLPGCFSMYRIKSPKGGDGYYVPILANPDIVEHYCENVVDTLHRKNLLLLGEDRYLTTLMLRTFPRRKMIFCPQAVCKTVVPDTFRVLLSQRRRWINSTIHNLFELMLVRDLCGTFCFSMQFVVFMELAGTLVLPAAIAFTGYLLIYSIIPGTEKPVIPLILLAIILGLPGALIVMTSRRFAYLGWLLIYLLSLPIWNFVLPAYAFLHMDDFSWGETRKIVGEKAETSHGDKEGEFDSSNITMKRWAEFERDRRSKNGQGRDTTFDGVLSRRPASASPHRSASNRYSIVSSAETYASGIASSGDALNQFGGGSQTPSEGHSSARHLTQLVMPAPLASGTSNLASASMVDLDDAEAAGLPVRRFAGNDASSSTSSLERPRRAAPPSNVEYSRYRGMDAYDDADDLQEREAILSPDMGYTPAAESYHSHSQQNVVYAEPEGMATSASASSNPFETASSRSSSPIMSPMTAPSHSQASASAASRFRGVSLVDAGPVPGSDGFRTIQRHQRRESRSTTGGAVSPSGTNNTLLSPASPPRSARNSVAPPDGTESWSPGRDSSSRTRGTLPPGAAPSPY